MKTERLSLANIKTALSRVELKKIMAGAGSGCTSSGSPCGYGVVGPPCCSGTCITGSGGGSFGYCK